MAGEGMIAGMGVAEFILVVAAVLLTLLLCSLFASCTLANSMKKAREEERQMQAKVSSKVHPTPTKQFLAAANKPQDLPGSRYHWDSEEGQVGTMASVHSQSTTSSIRQGPDFSSVRSSGRGQTLDRLGHRPSSGQGQLQLLDAATLRLTGRGGDRPEAPGDPVAAHLSRSKTRSSEVATRLPGIVREDFEDDEASVEEVPEGGQHSRRASAELEEEATRRMSSGRGGNRMSTAPAEVSPLARLASTAPAPAWFGEEVTMSPIVGGGRRFRDSVLKSTSPSRPRTPCTEIPTDEMPADLPRLEGHALNRYSLKSKALTRSLTQASTQATVTSQVSIV